MSRNLLFLTSLIAMIHGSCVPLEYRKDGVDPNLPPTPIGLWKEIKNLNPERTIRNLRATPFELHAITDNQFLRLNIDNQLIEKRSLQAHRVPIGMPILSDNSFFRASQGADNREYYEFHSVTNAQTVKMVISSDLVRRNETFTVERGRLRYPGAYSQNGSKFFLPGTVYPGNSGTARIEILILKLHFSPSTSEIDSISLHKRVSIAPQALSVGGRIETCRYMNGYLFLATADGAFRISEDGQVKEFFPHWTLDFYQRDGRIFSTGLGSYDFFYSSNSGDAWLRGRPTQLRFTEQVGQHIFTQRDKGTKFQLADSSMTKNKNIKYNNDTIFPNSIDSYHGVAFFQNQYYMSVEKKLFYNETILTE
jgi:hypothetical protein